MRSLKNKPQVNAPSNAYPYGRIRDDDGSGSVGTPVDEQVYGDFHQFFSQLMSDGGLVPNEIAENEYDGFQLNQALGLYIQKVSPPVPKYSDGLWQASNQGVYGTNWGDGSAPFKFRLTRNGTCVQLQGTALRSGTNASSETIYTFPIGYRPAATRFIMAYCTANATVATLSIATTGIVTLSLAAVSTPDIHMDNIEFVL